MGVVSFRMAKGIRNDPAAFWARVTKDAGCWLWTGMKDRDGYGKCGWQNRGHIRTHRIAFSLANPGWDWAGWVLHSCDTPLCCNPAHLWLGDARANAHDMIAKGRRADSRGSRHATAKLDEAQAIAIRQADGTHQQIADRYGVSRRLIGMIRSRVIWTHI
jgi:hypothetical protein